MPCGQRGSAPSGRGRLNPVVKSLLSERELRTALPYCLNIQDCVSVLLLIGWLGVGHHRQHSCRKQMYTVTLLLLFPSLGHCGFQYVC